MLTLLLPVFNTVELVDPRSEIGRVTSKGDFKGCQESIHPR